MATEHIVQGVGILVYPETGLFIRELRNVVRGDAFDPRAPSMITVQAQELYNSADFMVNPLSLNHRGHQGWSVSPISTNLAGRQRIVDACSQYLEQAITTQLPGWLTWDWWNAWTEAVVNPANPNVFVGEFVYRYFT